MKERSSVRGTGLGMVTRVSERHRRKSVDSKGTRLNGRVTDRQRWRVLTADGTNRIAKPGVWQVGNLSLQLDARP